VVILASSWYRHFHMGSVSLACVCWTSFALYPSIPNTNILPTSHHHSLHTRVLLNCIILLASTVHLYCMSVIFVALIFLQQQVWWKKCKALRQAVADNVALHAVSSVCHIQSTLRMFRCICKIAKGDYLLCHVCLSVHLHVTTWLQLARFSSNFIFEHLLRKLKFH